jgi:hypothetical protein
VSPGIRALARPARARALATSPERGSGCFTAPSAAASPRSGRAPGQMTDHLFRVSRSWAPGIPVVRTQLGQQLGHGGVACWQSARTPSATRPRRPERLRQGQEP